MSVGNQSVNSAIFLGVHILIHSIRFDPIQFNSLDLIELRSFATWRPVEPATLHLMPPAFGPHVTRFLSSLLLPSRPR
jgi:hypothetical protein